MECWCQPRSVGKKFMAPQCLHDAWYCCPSIQVGAIELDHKVPQKRNYNSHRITSFLSKAIYGADGMSIFWVSGKQMNQFYSALRTLCHITRKTYRINVLVRGRTIQYYDYLNTLVVKTLVLLQSSQNMRFSNPFWEFNFILHTFMFVTPTNFDGKTFSYNL